MKSYTASKNQIEGFKDVSETVKTVEKITASSIHLLKQNVLNLDTYINNTRTTLSQLSLFYQKNNHPLLRRNGSGKKAIIIITGEKGLVGGLWHSMISLFLEHNQQFQFVIVVGRKGKSYLTEEHIPITKTFSFSLDIPSKEEIESINNYVFSQFKQNIFSSVSILYPQFLSLAEQKPNISSFLPFGFNFIKEEERSGGIPIFEPSKQNFFDSLIQKYIEVFFYKIVMETKLSELSARTVAMEHATVKTKDFIKRLMLDYTKKKRRFITQRQLESFATHKM